MKKVILIILGVIGAGVGIVLAIAATKPDEFQIERSVSINASPEKIVAHIDNFHDWKDWSPWENLDPNMKRTFSGPETGVGAKYGWVGNNDVGEGDMEILESSPSNVKLKLHFIKPFEDTSIVNFTAVPQQEKTKITWNMSCKNQFCSKIMQVFMDMDQMIGKDFEKGLAGLKAVSEKPAAPAT